MYYIGIGMKGLRKTTKNLSQDSRSPGRDLNPGHPEYEAGLSTTRKRCSVLGCCGLLQKWKTKKSEKGEKKDENHRMKTARTRSLG
jgi:hypothetical protein